MGIHADSSPTTDRPKMRANTAVRMGMTIA